MFKLYDPTEVELEMLKYERFLVCKDNNSQDNIIGCTARAILDFDYHLYKSDDITGWDKGEQEINFVNKLIDLVKDETVRDHFRRCFNIEYHNKVMDIFEWGPYVNIQSKYVSYRFGGMTPEQASYKVGLYNWINDIMNMVQEHQCCYRALYSDNVYVANRVLKEGLFWFDDPEPIKPLTVPAYLWLELSKFGNMYKSNSIKYTELKELYPYNVNVMLDYRVEVLKINTFYMLFTY